MTEVIRVNVETGLIPWKVIREIFRLNHLAMFPMIEDVEEGNTAREFVVTLFEDVDRSRVVGLLGTIKGLSLSNN